MISAECRRFFFSNFSQNGAPVENCPPVGSSSTSKHYFNSAMQEHVSLQHYYVPVGCTDNKYSK